jgi:hypothetical protein
MGILARKKATGICGKLDANKKYLGTTSPLRSNAFLFLCYRLVISTSVQCGAIRLLQTLELSSDESGQHRYVLEASMKPLCSSTLLRNLSTKRARELVTVGIRL